MHIYNNYHSNPDILRPGVVTKIMKKIYTDIDLITQKSVKKFLSSMKLSNTLIMTLKSSQSYTNAWTNLQKKYWAQT